eukprot:6209142-Pleurochrysis_carterae.AAC.1
MPITIGQGAAQARGLGPPTGAASVRVAQRTAAAMRERGFQNLGSGARALRKYACNANAIWETVHASDETDGKNCTAREGQKDEL